MRDKDKKLMTTQVFFPFFFRKVLDGIAEHGAGIRLERKIKSLSIPDGLFAGFTEQPADGFVDQIVGVVQKQVRNSQTVPEISLPDKMHTADYSYPLFPHIGRVG